MGRGILPEQGTDRDDAHGGRSGLLANLTLLFLLLFWGSLLVDEQVLPVEDSDGAGDIVEILLTLQVVLLGLDYSSQLHEAVGNRTVHTQLKMGAQLSEEAFGVG